MNRKIWIGGLSVLIILAMTFTACGGSASANYSAASTPAAAPAAARDGMMYDMASAEIAEEAEKTAPDTGGGANAALEDRKIVKHSYMSMETMEFDKALEDVTRVIETAGGYIQNQEVGGRSLYNRGEYYERNANISARVPAAKLEEVTASVGGLCNVVSKSESMDDITDSYYDAQARLDTLELQEERLLDILSKAEKLEDVITLEQALSQVRYEIESITGTLKRMDSQVTYSYLNLDIQEVVEYNIAKNQPKTFWEKLQASGARSLDNITGALQGILFFAIEDLPVLLIFVGLIALIVWVVSRIVKKVSANRPPKPPVPPRPPYGAPPQAGGFQKYPPQPGQGHQEQPPEEKK